MNSKCFLLIVVTLLVALNASVFLDIPVMRQIFGFICLTFVPGVIIFKLLKLDGSDFSELVLFSVGFSVAFLMLGGLLVNEFASVLGVSQPLSVLPLMVLLNCLIMAGGILVYFRSGDFGKWPSIGIAQSPLFILFLCPPVLSIVGAIYATTYGNNLLLLFSIISIAILFVVGIFSKRLLPPNLYPLCVLIIAITLLMHSALISRYIIPYGSDVPGEYVVFKVVESNSRWVSDLPWGSWYGRMYSMLSITILPTFYAKILNIDPTWVFKLLYPLIFSLVPLGLYQIWQKYIDKKYALISVFLFVSFETFYLEMVGLDRQMIAELFFVLLFLVVLSRNMKPINKMMSFMVFGFALITSHYALAEIFIIFILSTLILLKILKRPNISITVPMIVFFSVLMFGWYIYVTGSTTFDSFIQYGNSVVRQLGDFFNPASRGETVMQGLGVAASPSIWNTISRIFAYLTQALIVLGAIGLFLKRVSVRFDREFVIFSFAALLTLIMLIVVPGLASTLNMTRFYHILQFFLAPLCFVGVTFFVGFFFRRKREFVVVALLLVVLVPYFLFQTEIVFEVTKSDSYSVALSGYRMDALRLYDHYGYADAYSVHGAQWLSANVDVQKTEVYADERNFANNLRIYGMIYGGSNLLSNRTIVGDGGVVYLSQLNVVYDKIRFYDELWNTSQLSRVFADLNMIYDNGGSEIYKHST